MKQRIHRLAGLASAWVILLAVRVAVAFVGPPLAGISHSSFRVVTATRRDATTTTATTSLLLHNHNDNKYDDATSSPTSSFVGGPKIDTKPDYENIVGPLGKQVDRLFLTVFRRQLAQRAGFESDKPAADYQGIVEITASLNKQVADRVEIQRRAQETLRALFPSWLPRSYAVLFSRPFPAFSARMNAWATKWAGTWLMGECEINDVLVDGDVIGKYQGLLVTRCRFLEESGCASVCVNSCKIPTQNFFFQDMGLPLTMEPNYTTFECQFSFGKTPNTTTELQAMNTPCLARCPTAGALREWHLASSRKKFQQPQQQQQQQQLVSPIAIATATTACQLMENDE